MTNSGFSRLLDLHEREDYNTALSEEAVRHMIAEEFEEADKIISVGFDEATFETLGADGQLFIPTRKSENFICESTPPASVRIITGIRSTSSYIFCRVSAFSISKTPSEA